MNKYLSYEKSKRLAELGYDNGDKSFSFLITDQVTMIDWMQKNFNKIEKVVK